MKLLKGIVVPTVTPLTSDGGLDEPSLRALLESIVAGGVHGIFAVGTTGEGPALSRSIRQRAVEVTCATIAGRVPVVVAAIETSLSDVLETAKHAAAAGAQAIAIAPPLYLALSQADTLRFGQLVANEAALPAYLYNVPYANLPQFHLETLEHLSKHDRILGLKDSSGHFDHLTKAVEIFASRPECSVLVGPERLLSQALRAGAAGGVSGGANLLPTLYVQLYDAFHQGHATRCEELQRRVLAVETDFYGVGDRESSLVRGLKTGLELRGIGTAVMAPPFRGPSDQEYREMRKTLSHWQDVLGLQSAVTL